MDRRNFLKNFSMFGLGWAITPALSFATNRAAAPADFCLNLITDDSARAIPLLEKLLARFLPAEKNLQYSEYPLAGTHLADLVLIENRRVVDYRRANEELAKGAYEVAKNLGLPKKVENPVLMKFYTEARRGAAQTLNIFGNNILLKRLSLTDDAGTHQIENAKGRITLVIRNKSAKIINATCRHQTCMKMGTINTAGQNLVCIPQQFRLSIEGQEESNFDGVTF